MYAEIIERWKKANPISTHMLGIHDYDGKLDDISENGIQTRIEELKNDLQKIASFDVPSDKIATYNRDLIKAVLDHELFELDVRKEYKQNPLNYIFPLTMIEMSFSVRNFAPLDDRIRSIVKLQEKIPDFLKQAVVNLEDYLPKAKVIMGMRFIPGIVNYYQHKLSEFVSQSHNDQLKQEWSEANLNAIEALNNFKNDLKMKYLPNAHNNFALGEKKFLELLKKQESVDITVKRLLEIGERDLKRNYDAIVTLGEQYGGLEVLLDKIYSDTPEPAELIPEVVKTLNRSKQFLIDSGFIDIPTDVQCEVIPTPEFAQAFASGAMNTPGPFETGEASEAYYWVTTPATNLSPEKVGEYMKFFARPMLEILTIHEAWPGHYLQLLFNNKSDNDIAKMFARSTSMIEGWGHYTEEAIYNAGYEPFDRHILHAAQLLKALMRNVRFISAVKMHCQGMTVEESAQLFVERSFMTPMKSQLEANRGTIDPMYLNYTLGKLMIFKLRDDFRSELEQKGEKFSLREFHNRLLSYGSPPISVVRRLMLDNPGGTQDIL